MAVDLKQHTARRFGSFNVGALGGSPKRRLRRHAPLALGIAAVIVAVVSTLAPAHAERSRFLWPGTRSASHAKAQLEVTPLLLERRSAATIAVHMGCALPPPLAGDRRSSVLVLATTRSTDAGGLSLQRVGGELQLSAGADGPIVLPAAPKGDCTRTLEIENERWSLRAGRGNVLAAGLFGSAPIVNGLVTALDIRKGGLSVVVTTQVDGVTLTGAQMAADVLAVLLALAALLLAGGNWSPRVFLRLPGAARRIAVVDVVVVVALLVWWIVGPVFYDDGWVRTRQLNYVASGQFSNYFDTWGASLPFAHWLEWVQHWLVLTSGSVPVLRLLPLAAGLVGWAISRVALREALGPAVGALARWTLASIYLVAFFAWGMTLRPEPVVAALVVGALACMLRFLRSPGVGPLAVFVVLAALAMSAHPAAIVALAPLIAAGPALLAWAREGGRALLSRLVAVLAAGTALGIVLLFAGTDFSWWREQDRLFAADSAHQSGWRDELVRYTNLDSSGYGTPIRRLMVGFLLVAVVAFLTRRHRMRRPAQDLPVLSLILALALLVFTPSKWPWHFGVLSGIGAVALASEVSRLFEEGRERNWRLDPRPFGAIVVVLGMNGWAWLVNTQWNDLDLRSLQWHSVMPDLSFGLAGYASLGSLRQWAAVLAILLVGTVIWQRSAAGRWNVRRPFWLVGAIVASLVASGALIYTTAYYIRDAQVTTGWTLVRQNLDTLRGKRTCGAADGIVFPRPDSITALAPVFRRARPSPGPLIANGTWPPDSRPPFGNVHVWGTWGTTRPATESVWTSPWYVAPPRKASVGLYVAGSGDGNIFHVDWGRREGRRILNLGGGAANLPDPGGAGDAGDSAWTLLTATDLPSRPSGANVLRLAAAQSDVTPGDWLGISSPVRYERETLAEAIRRVPGQVLISPDFSLYFPCAMHVPKLAHGRADVPRLSAVQLNSFPLTDSSSPFNGVTDLYGVFQLPLDESPLVQRALIVYADEPLGRGVAAGQPVRRVGS